MTSKAQITLQEDCFRKWLDQHATKSAATKHYKSHKSLVKALDHFFQACPRDMTRTSCLTSAIEFVTATPPNLDAWAKWFMYPDFMTPLLPCMQRRWQRGERTLLVYQRNRLPVLPKHVTNKPKLSEKEKEQQLKAEIKELDKKAGFTKFISGAQLESLQFTCKTCHRKGCISWGNQQTRGADEGGTVSEECEMCSSRVRS